MGICIYVAICSEYSHIVGNHGGGAAGVGGREGGLKEKKRPWEKEGFRERHSYRNGRGIERKEERERGLQRIGLKVTEGLEKKGIGLDRKGMRLERKGIGLEGRGSCRMEGQRERRGWRKGRT
jgi:hypothetical protein